MNPAMIPTVSFAFIFFEPTATITYPGRAQREPELVLLNMFPKRSRKSNREFRDRTKSVSSWFEDVLHVPVAAENPRDVDAMFARSIEYDISSHREASDVTGELAPSSPHSGGCRELAAHLVDLIEETVRRANVVLGNVDPNILEIDLRRFREPDSPPFPHPSLSPPLESPASPGLDVPEKRLVENRGLTPTKLGLSHGDLSP